MSEEIIWVFIVNSACSFILTGLIWFVQVVHYPSFRAFHRADFKKHHWFHIRRTAYVTAPFMTVELMTSFVLSLQSEIMFIHHLIGLIVVVIIWLSTFFIQAPIHFKLRKGFNEELIKRLIDTNWLRTILWSVKSLLAMQLSLDLLF